MINSFMKAGIDAEYGEEEEEEEEVTATEEEGKEDCRSCPLLLPVPDPPALSLSLLMPTGLMFGGST